MERLSYALYCRRLESGHIWARLVGENFELTAPDEKSLRNSAAMVLRKAREQDEISDPRILAPKIKRLVIPLHPSYEEEDGVFPSPYVVELAVDAIYGESSSGYYSCSLPAFQEKFYFKDPAQIGVLAEHFVRNMLGKKSPEVIHRYMEPEKTWLEEVIVKIKEREGRPRDSGPDIPALGGVAVLVPRPRTNKETSLPTHQAAWERSEEVQDLINRIQNERANVLVVGEPRSGKSNLIHEAARKIARENRGRSGGRNATLFFRTTPHRLISGARYLGEWQQLCEEIVEDLQSVNGTLWVLDFLNLFSAGGDGPEDSIAAFLRPHLERGRFRMIGEMTPRELEAAQRLLPGFTGLFQIVRLREMDESSMRKLLELYRDYAKSSYRVEFEPAAMDLSYLLLKRYMPYESFPGKAVDFFRDRLDEALLEERTTIERNDVFSAFIKRTGFPEKLLRDEIPLDRQATLDYFQSKIIGQSEATSVLCSVIGVFKAGLNNPARPIASLLFTGPTGVGKTASAQSLADFLFGSGDGGKKNRDRLIRIDMSEFQHPSQMDRLIGGGGAEQSEMIRRLRERPFGVVLFDEIEKAHPAVFDALLGMLDEGRLVDSLGRETDFRNTVIVMTSNLGSDEGAQVGFGADRFPDYHRAVKNFFRPEFFNRIDSIVPFAPLDQASVRKIAALELARIAKRDGIKKRGLVLKFSDGVAELLTKEGFDPVYGARPLLRASEKYVTSALARFLLKNRGVKNCTLRLDFDPERGVVIRNES